MHIIYSEDYITQSMTCTSKRTLFYSASQMSIWSQQEQTTFDPKSSGADLKPSLLTEFCGLLWNSFLNFLVKASERSAVTHSVVFPNPDWSFRVKRIVKTLGNALSYFYVRVTGTCKKSVNIDIICVNHAESICMMGAAYTVFNEM